MAETDDWLARLAKMHHVVQEWMQRTTGEHEPEAVQPGSSLAADDSLFPRHPVSSCVWHGLLTAVEHPGQSSKSWSKPSSMRCRPRRGCAPVRRLLEDA
ncbi:hypothetical protein AB0D86_47590 [Streptomyces sp. NPDC048324]|uniref:hypothetical protein n=1 Tax=Streptomyces sp. NPDC048324 TaxID=3157205 RepID=UPI0034278AE5